MVGPGSSNFAVHGYSVSSFRPSPILTSWSQIRHLPRRCNNSPGRLISPPYLPPLGRSLTTNLGLTLSPAGVIRLCSLIRFLLLWFVSNHTLTPPPSTSGSDPPHLTPTTRVRPTSLLHQRAAPPHPNPHPLVTGPLSSTPLSGSGPTPPAQTSFL